MFKPLIAAIVMFVALTGCSFDETEGAHTFEETLYYQLGNRERLTLQQPSLIGVSAYDRDGEPLPCVQPDVTGGETAIRATSDGLLVVEGLAIDLTDITIEPGVVHPDEAIQLTDVHLRLGTQVAFQPEWNVNGRQVSGIGHGDLLMDWALLDNDGNVLPLAPQKIRDAELFVDVRMSEDSVITADVNSNVDGTIWDFSAVELADFSMAVHASTAPVVE